MELILSGCIVSARTFMELLIGTPLIVCNAAAALAGVGVFDSAPAKPSTSPSNAGSDEVETSPSPGRNVRW